MTSALDVWTTHMACANGCGFKQLINCVHTWPLSSITTGPALLQNQGPRFWPTFCLQAIWCGWLAQWFPSNLCSKPGKGSWFAWSKCSAIFFWGTWERHQLPSIAQCVGIHWASGTWLGGRSSLMIMLLFVTIKKKTLWHLYWIPFLTFGHWFRAGRW